MTRDSIPPTRRCALCDEPLHEDLALRTLVFPALTPPGEDAPVFCNVHCRGEWECERITEIVGMLSHYRRILRRHGLTAPEEVPGA